MTTIRYEPSRTEHEYVSDLDDEMGEMMLRMQTLNVVYQALRDASEPSSADGDSDISTPEDVNPGTPAPTPGPNLGRIWVIFGVLMIGVVAATAFFVYQKDE